MRSSASPRQRRRRVTALLIVAGLLALAGGVYAYQQWLSDRPTATKGSTGKGGGKTASGLDQPPSSAPSSSPTPAPTSAPQTTPASGGAPAPASVKPEISTAPYVSGGQVHLRAFATGAGFATCKVQFTHATAAPITAEAPTNHQDVCQGFDLDAAKFAKGEWTAVVTVTSTNVNGASDAAKFTIQ